MDEQPTSGRSGASSRGFMNIARQSFSPSFSPPCWSFSDAQSPIHAYFSSFRHQMDKGAAEIHSSQQHQQIHSSQHQHQHQQHSPRAAPIPPVPSRPSHPAGGPMFSMPFSAPPPQGGFALPPGSVAPMASQFAGAGAVAVSHAMVPHSAAPAVAGRAPAMMSPFMHPAAAAAAALMQPPYMPFFYYPPTMYPNSQPFSYPPMPMPPMQASMAPVAPSPMSPYMVSSVPQGKSSPSCSISPLRHTCFRFCAPGNFQTQSHLA